MFKLLIRHKQFADKVTILSISGALSVKSGNTEVAFSEQDYPLGNEQPGAVLLKV